MTQRRPIEVANASKACADAWQKRDDMIEAGDEPGAAEMSEVCILMEERYNDLYRQWQDLGGTSNIETLALHGLVESTSPFSRQDEIENWDFTPFPKNMPDIKFDTIDEIPF